MDAKFKVRDLTIFMSYTRQVCQVSGHEKNICPVFTVGEKVMVPFKVKEKRSHSCINTVIDMQQLKMF